MAAVPIIAAVYSAYSQNKAAHANRDAAKMQLEAAQAAQTTKTTQTVIPLADGAAVQAAKRKSILDQINSRGRASTLLSDPSGDKLGG